ncbi:MAG: hypothetical protein NUW00_00130 [Candidatus Kaiserbacteria bacterium]|nr:hypothetical protein [Candidatus Kaiserbacteria bacterium]
MQYSHIKQYVWGGFVLCLFALTTAPVYATTLSSENFKVTTTGSDTDGGTTFSSTNYSITSKANTEDSDDVVSGGSQGSKKDAKLQKPDFTVLPEIIVGTQRENIVPKNNVPQALRDDVLSEQYTPGTNQNSKLSEVNTARKDNGAKNLSASVISGWTMESLREFQGKLGDIFKERSARAIVLGTVIGGLLLIRRTKIGRGYFPF